MGMIEHHRVRGRGEGGAEFELRIIGEEGAGEDRRGSGTTAAHDHAR